MKKTGKFILLGVGLIIVLFLIIILFFREGEYVDGCSYVASEVADKVIEVSNMNETIIFREGDLISEDDYFIFAIQNVSYLFEAVQLYNSTSPDYTEDIAKIQDVIGGEIYDLSFVSEGKGVLMLNGFENTANLFCNETICYLAFDYYPPEIKFDYTSCEYWFE